MPRSRIEVADDGDGAAAADEDRLLAEDVVHGRGGGADVGVVGGDDDGVAHVDEAHVERDAFGAEGLDVGLVLARRFRRESCRGPDAWRLWRWRGRG